MSVLIFVTDLTLRDRGSGRFPHRPGTWAKEQACMHTQVDAGMFPEVSASASAVLQISVHTQP